jgi:hypothetical protein
MVAYASPSLLLQRLRRDDDKLRVIKESSIYVLHEETCVDTYRTDWSRVVATIPTAAVRRVCRQAYLHGMAESRVKGTLTSASSIQDYWTGTSHRTPEETRPARFRLAIVVKPDGPRLSVEEIVHKASPSKSIDNFL